MQNVSLSRKKGGGDILVGAMDISISEKCYFYQAAKCTCKEKLLFFL